ncbi:hypothetical protein JKG47_17465 [Acidithiobacillus sp. MC6.1]|nr:hypothetical protein [Acidithiobacillus sp. MC6.1]
MLFPGTYGRCVKGTAATEPFLLYASWIYLGGPGEVQARGAPRAQANGDDAIAC